jgi:ADP-heptose:LPS heptosyltransferase
LFCWPDAYKTGKKLKILIIRFSSYGDIILTTPIIDAIRKRYPAARIDFLVMDRFVDAIRLNGHIHTLIPFEKEKFKGIVGIFHFSQRLRKEGYDLVVDLHAKVRSIIMSHFMATRVVRYRKRRWWKTLGVNLRLIRYRVDDTIVRNYWHPLARLGIPCPPERLTFDYSKEDLRRMAPFGGTVLFAPGAANPTKRWPAEYFARLGVLLSQEITLIGGPGDFEELEEIRKYIGPRCRNLAGELDLKESGALIAASRYLVCNDSGPFHMARGVGTKAFVIFGPTDPNMFTFNENAVLIYAHLKCAPCSLHGDRKCPRGHFRCMLDLTPQKVFKWISAQK